ncbi:MAG: GntR family transcriptional regulator [Kiloniellales bacterium]|nr:GntR family transcriptional regulator [Kiloniellales bacterium]MDJ0983804.1 GntR family transcriptional regulator [Kiloniellales bacterium]
MARGSSRLPDATPGQETGGRIERRSLHHEVVGRLRGMILQGELQAGERIPERELCDRFGISRTPLREALKVLATEGLIDLLPNRGAAVSRISAEGLREAFQVMGALEALGGELACARITDTEIAAIRQLHERMVGHYRAGRLNDYFALNQKIHEAILAAAENRMLTELYGRLRGQVQRARFAANLSETRWRQAVAEHEEMMVALDARDAEKLGKLLKRHLSNKFDTLLDVVAEDRDRAAE